MHRHAALNVWNSGLSGKYENPPHLFAHESAAAYAWARSTMANMIAAKPANRRESLRRKTRASVLLTCRIGALGMGRNISRSVLDLSDTGVRLIVSAELSLPTEVEICITSYGVRQPIKRIADVRWQVELADGTFCIGIEFQKRLTYRDWQALAAPNG
jgi:hypothetical protein